MLLFFSFWISNSCLYVFYLLLISKHFNLEQKSHLKWRKLITCPKAFLYLWLPLAMKKWLGYRSLKQNRTTTHSTENDPRSTKSPLNNSQRSRSLIHSLERHDVIYRGIYDVWCFIIAQNYMLVSKYTYL